MTSNQLQYSYQVYDEKMRQQTLEETTRHNSKMEDLESQKLQINEEYNEWYESYQERVLNETKLRNKWEQQVAEGKLDQVAVDNWIKMGQLELDNEYKTNMAIFQGTKLEIDKMIAETEAAYKQKMSEISEDKLGLENKVAEYDRLSKIESNYNQFLANYYNYQFNTERNQIAREQNRISEMNAITARSTMENNWILGLNSNLNESRKYFLEKEKFDWNRDVAWPSTKKVQNSQAFENYTSIFPQLKIDVSSLTRALMQ